MAALVVLTTVFFDAVKIFSYGAWEMKRQNRLGGGFVMLLGVSILALAIRYTVRYYT